MAVLLLENGRKLTEIDAINTALAPLGVSLKHWPVGNEAELHALLARDALNDEEKEQTLRHFDRYFNQLKDELGYQTRDLIVVHPQIPNLDAMLAKFEPCHTHDDDEVRYIVDGEGVFGFVMPDGSQAELLLKPGEYINVPKDTEHWFHLTAVKRIKAVRYFTSMDGWSPNYTQTPRRVPALENA